MKNLLIVKRELSLFRLYVAVCAFQITALAGMAVLPQSKIKGAWLIVAGVCGSAFYFGRLVHSVWRKHRSASRLPKTRVLPVPTFSPDTAIRFSRAAK